MKTRIILALLSILSYAAEAQNPPIKVVSTDVVGTALPFHIDDNPSALTFGTNTHGRQIRLSRLDNTYYFDIGLDNTNNFFITKRNSNEIAFKIKENGNIGIGTTDPGNFKLAVEGKIGAREVKVTLQNPWPDYVFNKDYQRMTLASLEAFIKKNNHLPNMPSAQEVKENGGIDLGEMNAKLLEKIEELTLYVIELKKEDEEIRKELKSLREKITHANNANKP